LFDLLLGEGKARPRLRTIKHPLFDDYNLLWEIKFDALACIPV
jgi:hypothetical protein